MQSRDRIARKMEQEAKHRRVEKLSKIDYDLALSELDAEDNELTIVDPESATSITFHFPHMGAFGRSNG